MLAAPGGLPSPSYTHSGEARPSPGGRGGPGRDRPPARPEPPSRAQAPLQDWGEETEDGAVYSVSLRRQRSQRLSPREGPGDGQVSGDWRAGRAGEAGAGGGESPAGAQGRGGLGGQVSG